MAEPLIPSASLFLGIIPALLLLYLSLKGYEGLYKEKNIFLSFIVGIVVGVVAIIIESIAKTGMGVFFQILLFPVVDQLLKTMVLNIGRLHEKKETVIYGLILGLGFGSVFTPFLLITSSSQINMGFFGIFFILIGSFGVILLQGACGVCIGYGVYTHRLLHYITFAVMLSIPVNVIIFVTNLFQVDYLQIGIIGYGILVYWYMTKKIMPRIQPDHWRRLRRQTQRKNI